MDRLATFRARALERVAAGAYAPRGEALEPNGPFAAAVRSGSGIVAELKPASPSRGRLLRGPVDQVLAAYRAGGAAALSILTDADHFGGSPALLREAHAHGLPTLMKDFIVHEAQVACARHQGASAVLLVERLFRGEPERREELVRAAHALGLEVLLELFDADDWAAARGSAADLLGVNARDLETLEVDEADARTLLAEVAAHRPVLALSGIRRRPDARAARRAGACGILVGTMLMEAPDPELALRALRRPLSKVCGLRTQAELADAARAGADLAGLVVGAPQSPRDLPPLTAQRLADDARALGLRPVLVTPHADPWEVREWCRLVRPAFVQVSGFRPEAAWVRSLRAIPTHVLEAVDGAAPGADSAGFVADSPHGGLGGGTGQTHDWARTLRLVEADPARLSLVAGGLDAGNAAAALAATGAWGADASSRLESAPGRKDPGKVAAFVQAVQGA
jgi:indole-3-glycerol phosphate synthase/phosphoribosylanthranilate isomerase